MPQSKCQSIFKCYLQCCQLKIYVQNKTKQKKTVYIYDYWYNHGLSGAVSSILVNLWLDLEIYTTRLEMKGSKKKAQHITYIFLRF